MKKGKKYNKYRMNRLDETHYKQQLHMFEYTTKDNKLIFEFETFARYNLSILTGEMQKQNKKIKITDMDIRSAINGRYRDELVEYLNNMNKGSKQKNPNWKPKHQADIITATVSESSTFQKLMNEVKKFNNNITETGYQWNIVSYRDFLEGVRTGAK